jgi:hypothetical protein
MPNRVALMTPVLFQRLALARRVLVAGAGGGFDVFAGLPIALSLLQQGKEVAFGNLTFTYLGGTTARWLAPNVATITPECEGEDRYFPERTLARFLASRAITAPVYAFEKVGVRPLGAAYAAVCHHFSPDAIVLVDGGTDILMFGDEAGLGTPQEDMASLAAVSSLVDISERVVACIGFGIDAYHGVCHAHFLENVATLERDGAYLGAFSVPRTSDEGRVFLDAVAAAHAETPGRPSIVNGSIAAAVNGDFGNVQFTERTNGSELFVNPLMGLYFTFDLVGLAARSLYLKQLRHTETIFEVGAIIEAFRRDVAKRPRRAIPH